MCVAIFKPYNRDISEADLRSCFTRNPDGAGFMYPLDGKVVVAKGYFTFDSFYKDYLEHVTGPAKDTGVAIHFRIGTSGLKDTANCHPHILAEDFAFIHNGVMSEFAYTNSKKSDTAHFMEEVLRPFYKASGGKFLNIGYTFNLIQNLIGAWNKMLFMDGTGLYWMMNKKGWHDVDHVMYSNLNWQTTAKVYSGNVQTYPDIAYPAGCWIGGKWSKWDDYRLKYPECNGPFENEWALHTDDGKKYLGGGTTIRSRVTGQYYDADSKTWKDGKPGDKKKEEEVAAPPCDSVSGCEAPGPTETKTIGAEVDELGNVIKESPDMMTGTGFDKVRASIDAINEAISRPIDSATAGEGALFESAEEIQAKMAAISDSMDNTDTFPDSRCINCKRDIPPEEAAVNGTRMCLTCEVWAAQAMGATEN